MAMVPFATLPKCRNTDTLFAKKVKNWTLLNGRHSSRFLQFQKPHFPNSLLFNSRLIHSVSAPFRQGLKSPPLTRVLEMAEEEHHETFEATGAGASKTFP